jgi:hypothetical protein
MKPIFPRLAASLIIVILLAACNLPQGGVNGPDSGTVSTKVALTLVALTQSAQQVPITSPGSPTSVQPAITQNPTLTGTTAPTFTQIPSLPPTETIAPTNTPLSAPGTIAGSISGYPYGSIPKLAIVAFQQESPYNRGYVMTNAGETYYENSSNWIIPGHFQVVAYDSSGHTGGCTSIVEVISNTTVTCNITNWGGGYPSKPSFVPNP